jgi:hypothetical protein
MEAESLFLSRCPENTDTIRVQASERYQSAASGKVKGNKKGQKLVKKEAKSIFKNQKKF